MKSLLVIFSTLSLAFASLEPAGYQPPQARQYLAPAIQAPAASRQYLAPQASAPRNAYLAPVAAAEPLEPAKYEYQYQVNDNESGNDYAHEESRDGDKAMGMYSVLLPDGRKLTVRYEADQEGYRPEISYEEPQAPRISHYSQGGPY